jgi:hypothetical protein
LSFGSLSASHSLYHSLYPETIELIIELDVNIGSEDVPEEIRRSCWKRHMHRVEFPPQWPVSPFLPQSHLYGTGQFKRAAQTAAVQALIIVRMAYLWAKGVVLKGRGGPSVLMSSVSMCVATGNAFKYFDDFRQIEDAWTRSEEEDAKVARQLGFGLVEDPVVEPAGIGCTNYLSIRFRRTNAKLFEVAWTALLDYPWTCNPPEQYLTIAHAVKQHEIEQEALLEAGKAAAALGALDANEEVKGDADDSGVLGAVSAAVADPVDGAGGLVEDVETSPVDPIKQLWLATQARLIDEAGALLKSDHDVYCGEFQQKYNDDKKLGLHKGTASMCHVDPWYETARVPDDAELQTLVSACEYYGKPRCVVVMWFPWQKAEHFMKWFQASGNWTVDNYVKKVVRDRNQIGRGGSSNTLKGCTDQCMIIYRNMGAQQAKKESKKSWSNGYKMNLEQVVSWFGDPKDYTTEGRQSAPNGGFPWSSDIIYNYKPPWKRQRLRFDDGTPMRPGAEKSVQCMQLLIQMYTKDGTGDHRATLYEPYAGTMAAGLAALTLNREYIGCEKSVPVFNGAEMRLRQFIAGRLRGGNKSTEPIPLNTGGCTVEAAQVVTMLACRDLHNIAQTMFPPGYDPEVTKTGALANHHGNLEIHEVPKEELLKKGKRSMGQGVYTTIHLKAGQSLETPLYAYGTLVEDDGSSGRGMMGQPVRLKARCFEGIMMLPGANCIMRWINDSRGTGAKANVIVIESQVENLAVNEGYKLLEVIPITDIARGTQLLRNFGTTGLSVNHVDDEGTPMDGDDAKTRRGRRAIRNKTALQTGRDQEDDSSEDDDEIEIVEEDPSDEGEESGEEHEYEGDETDEDAGSGAASGDEGDDTGPSQSTPSTILTVMAAHMSITQLYLTSTSHRRDRTDDTGRCRTNGADDGDRGDQKEEESQESGGEEIEAKTR